MSSHPNLTFNFVKTHLTPDWEWDWYNLTKNPNITMEDIEKNPECHWDMWSITSNPNLTIEFVEKYKGTYGLDPEFVALSPCISMEYIEKTRNQLNWIWHLLSANSNIKIEDMEAHTEYPWDLEFVSVNPNLTMEFIDKHASEMDFGMISDNKFTYERSRTTKLGSFMLLEKEKTFHKLLNLFIVKKYM